MSEQDTVYPKPQDLELLSGTTTLEYAKQIIDDHMLIGSGGLDSPKMWVETVSESFAILLETQPDDDLEAAKALLIGYGQELQTRFLSRFNEVSNENYLPWIHRVRMIAGLSPAYSNELGVNTTYYAGQGQSSTQFWQEVYAATAHDKKSREALSAYALSPGIELKDSEVLLALIVEIENAGLTEALYLNNKRPVIILSGVFDGVKHIVSEAGESGWRNAAALIPVLEKLIAIGAPKHTAIITLANQVTKLLNKEFSKSDSVLLDTLSTRDIKNIPEAIDRILTIIFEYGEQPTDHDPLNYILSGQILGALSLEADERLRK